MFQMNLQMFGGRGGSSGVYSLAKMRQDMKRVTTLTQQITRMQNNIRIAEGRISGYEAASMGATEGGRQRVRSAQNTYEKDKARLGDLIKERDKLNKKLDAQRRRNERATRSEGSF